MPTSTKKTLAAAPTRPSDLHPTKPTTGPAADARAAVQRAHTESVKISDAGAEIKRDRQILHADLVEAISDGKSTTKLLTKASELHNQTRDLASQQTAIDTVTSRLTSILADAESRDTQLKAWRTTCKDINAAWNRLEREALEMWPPAETKTRGLRNKTAADADRTRVNEERRAWLEAERLHLADRYS